MRRTHSLLLFVAAILPLSIAHAAQSSGEEETQIRTIVQTETDAWNRGDAEALAAHHAENGSFTNVIGQQLYGRQAFIAQRAKIFSTIYKGSHNTFRSPKSPSCARMWLWSR